MFGEDAKQAAALLDLQLGTRPVQGVGRVAFCGIPVSSLERFSEKLREQYDLAVSAVKADGSGREVYEIPSIGIQDKRVLKIVGQMLKAGYVESDLYHATTIGTPQGGILSPLLSNVYLNDFDWYVGRKYIPEGQAEVTGVLVTAAE